MLFDSSELQRTNTTAYQTYLEQILNAFVKYLLFTTAIGFYDITIHQTYYTLQAKRKEDKKASKQLAKEKKD